MQLIQRMLVILSYPFQLLFAAPVALLTASRRVQGLSLAARLALAVALFMVLMTVAATLLARTDDLRIDWLSILQNYTLPLAIFTLLTPPVVYVAVWLWSEGRESRYPDIDRAWREGVAALAREGLSLAESPVFLILGIRSEHQARSFMKASGLQFAVRGAPEGLSPLYFYAVKDYSLNNETWNPIFLLLTDVSQTSKLVALASDSGRERLAARGDDTVRSEGMHGTYVGSSEAAANDLRGTLVGGAASPAPGSLSSASSPLGGTLVVGEPAGSSTFVAAGPAGGLPLLLDKQEASRQSGRLRHVCRMLAGAREPYCPVNGVLVVTPFTLLRRGLEQVRHLATATSQDLKTIQRKLQIRCPVISLVGGMEHEPGFGELVRRVGAARAMEQRFGKGFEPWNPATRQRLEALAVHVCGTFEDNVYSLFKEPDGYNKPGNGKLYGLLCRTRSGFVDVLGEYLATAFGQQDATSDDQPMLFNGCYFAATGEIERLQGFLKGVLADKLLQNQDDLQWTDEGQRQDASYDLWARLGMVATGLLVLLTVVLAYFHFWRE
ncbi:MAG: type VI secretion protein IcmF/TssM N-terminal domain-containing protein [Pirellulaceae bacterium]